MYQYYADNTYLCLLVRHFGTFERAEHIAALWDLAVRYKDQPGKFVSIWLDVRDVEVASLQDTDVAFRTLSVQKFGNMERPFDGLRIARVMDKNSPVFSVLADRSGRHRLRGVSRENHASARDKDGNYLGEVPGYFASFTDLHKARAFLGLPTDYLPDWRLAGSPQ